MSEKDKKRMRINLIPDLSWIFFAIGCVIIFHGCKEDGIERIRSLWG